MKKKISVLGLGYVGTVLFGCLVREGYNVIGVDIDPVKLELIKKGVSPIIEEGMDQLIAEAIQSDLSEISNDAVYSILNSDVSFTCVGTPSLPNGSQDLSALKRIAIEFGKAMKENPNYHVFVIRSTVIPGTVENLVQPLIEEYSGKKTGIDFGICFQPEFLREGTSIDDYYNPPFTVVGGDSISSVDVVKGVFDHLSCEFITTSIGTAEMMKYVCNIFHALKITFANEIGRFCKSYQVDAHEVMDIVCKDKILNISSAYMKPGFAFGGSCLPKDLRGLNYAAKIKDINLPMLSNVMLSNQVHIDHVVDMILEKQIREVGIAGLSFKGGTDDLRESPLVTMAEMLIGKGMILQIYDPKVNLSKLIGANRNYIEKSIPHISSLMTDSCEQVIGNSKIIVVGQNNKEFIETLYLKCTSEHYVIDLVGCVDRNKLKGEYTGACWS